MAFRFRTINCYDFRRNRVLTCFGAVLSQPMVKIKITHFAYQQIGDNIIVGR